MADTLADLRRQLWLTTLGTDASMSNADLERAYLLDQLGITDSPLSNADLELEILTGP